MSLDLYEASIDTIGVFFERVVVSSLNYLAAVQNDNFVAIPNGAQAMGDNDTRAATAPQVVVDDLLCRYIERTGGFV